MSKGHAFLICGIAIMVIFISLFVVVIIKGTDLSLIPVGASLTALVSVTTAYMSIQVVNNGVKGRNWNQQMFDSENKEEEVR